MLGFKAFCAKLFFTCILQLDYSIASRGVGTLVFGRNSIWVDKGQYESWFDSYGNKAEVEAGIAASWVVRSEIFITSMLSNTKHHPEDMEAAWRKTLVNLGVDYIILYIVYTVSGFEAGKTVIYDCNLLKNASFPWFLYSRFHNSLLGTF